MKRYKLVGDKDQHRYRIWKVIGPKGLQDDACLFKTKAEDRPLATAVTRICEIAFQAGHDAGTNAAALAVIEQIEAEEDAGTIPEDYCEVLIHHCADAARMAGQEA